MSILFRPFLPFHHIDLNVSPNHRLDLEFKIRTTSKINKQEQPTNQPTQNFRIGIKVESKSQPLDMKIRHKFPFPVVNVDKKDSFILRCSPNRLKNKRHFPVYHLSNLEHSVFQKQCSRVNDSIISLSVYINIYCIIIYLFTPTNTCDLNLKVY